MRARSKAKAPDESNAPNIAFGPGEFQSVFKVFVSHETLHTFARTRTHARAQSFTRYESVCEFNEFSLLVALRAYKLNALKAVLFSPKI